MKLSIEALRGVWRAQVGPRTYFADTLEELLLILAPDAPEEYVWHTAEVLGSILGAAVVENDYSGEQMSAEDWASFLESWQPTEAQQAYFKNERSEEAQEFDPDEMPRGV